MATVWIMTLSPEWGRNLPKFTRRGGGRAQSSNAAATSAGSLASSSARRALCPLTVLSQPSLASSDPHPLVHPQALDRQQRERPDRGQPARSGPFLEPNLPPSWNPICPSGPKKRPGTERIRSAPLGQSVQSRNDARIPGQVTSGGGRELASGQGEGRAGRGPWAPPQSPHGSYSHQ